MPTRPVVRPIDPGAEIPLDERLWPSNLALLFFTVAAGGVIVADGGFADPRLLHNEFVRLVTLGITVAFLGWAMATKVPRRARRLQFCVLTSMIAHLLLAFVLHDSWLGFPERRSKGLLIDSN